MIIQGFIWFSEIVDKLESKHGVSTYEAESIFAGKPIYKKIQKGHVRDENLYRALGKTGSGRHPAVFFIYKKTHEILIISARNMTEKEKKNYAKRKK